MCNQQSDTTVMVGLRVLLGCRSLERAPSFIEVFARNIPVSSYKLQHCHYFGCYRMDLMISLLFRLVSLDLLVGLIFLSHVTNLFEQTRPSKLIVSKYSLSLSLCTIYFSILLLSSWS